MHIHATCAPVVPSPVVRSAGTRAHLKLQHACRLHPKPSTLYACPRPLFTAARACRPTLLASMASSRRRTRTAACLLGLMREWLEPTCLWPGNGLLHPAYLHPPYCPPTSNSGRVQRGRARDRRLSQAAGMELLHNGGQS